MMTWAWIFQTVLTWVYGVLASCFLLRTWGLAARLPDNAPAFQSLLRFTDPVVGWVNRLLRNPRPLSFYNQGYGVFEWTSLLVAYLIVVLGLLMVYGVLGGGFFLLAAILSAIFGVLNLLFTLAIWILVIAVILSWVNPSLGIYMPLQMLLAPLLSPIRRYVPTVGIFDLSYLILLIVLQLAQHGLYRLQQQLLFALS